MSLKSLLSRIKGSLTEPVSATAAAVAVDASPSAPVVDPLVLILASALREQDFNVTEVRPHDLTLSSGIRIAVKGVEVEVMEDDVRRTVTHSIATHDTLFPEGLAEYQHANGSTMDEALAKGFRSWSSMDVATMQDALLDDPQECMVMKWEKAATDTTPALTRRIVFGPTIRTAKPVEEGDDDDFCPCCLFTSCLEIFQPLLETNRTFGIRLFAMRDEDGEFAADCRVDGEDFTEGVAGLIDYVATWPHFPGMEFRKQYVVVHSVTPVIAA